jgi:hypothetical protein
MQSGCACNFFGHPKSSLDLNLNVVLIYFFYVKMSGEPTNPIELEHDSHSKELVVRAKILSWLLDKFLSRSMSTSFYSIYRYFSLNESFANSLEVISTNFTSQHMDSTMIIPRAPVLGYDKVVMGTGPGNKTIIPGRFVEPVFGQLNPKKMNLTMINELMVR